MWIKYNANPINNRVGDCTVRAISTALNQSWEETDVGLFLQSFMDYDMPSANAEWGKYLKRKGFSRHLVPDDLCYEYTVSDFCRDNPDGVYILALSDHVVAVKNGDYYDTWDSGDEIPIYYWCKKENVQ
ncbi:MAG: hypothetical protein NC253_05385 [Ruminococcus sp.]|nr:hypothetical protein [Ruminococcus sp.]MCM1381804.1 hypothetical protein [Muribaculaceae bacterium]MCM1478262.1 hypothetical protein [Muribaculaceae bacterium]